MSRVIFEYWYSRGWLKNVTMLKLMDKTNIDFIGPRYICMAGSLILIVLGLIATFVRGQTMFNIDFTGGTLVTIRLDEKDPSVQPLSESKGTELVRQKATSVLPDVTVESLRISGDQSLARFNIRTTDQSPEQVKQRILEAFGSSLARIEMTFTEGEPIAAATAATQSEASKPTTTLAGRFAGGREYHLHFNTTAFNSTQAPDQVVSGFFAGRPR